MSAAKVYLSTDIEGTAGIVDWSQVIGPGARSTRSGGGCSWPR